MDRVTSEPPTRPHLLSLGTTSISRICFQRQDLKTHSPPMLAHHLPPPSVAAAATTSSTSSPSLSKPQAYLDGTISNMIHQFETQVTLQIVHSPADSNETKLSGENGDDDYPSSDGEYDDVHTCGVCDRAFTTVRQLVQHQNSRKHFLCFSCDAIFPSLGQLQSHQKSLSHYTSWEEEEAASVAASSIKGEKVPSCNNQSGLTGQHLMKQTHETTYNQNPNLHSDRGVGDGKGGEKGVKGRGEQKPIPNGKSIPPATTSSPPSTSFDPIERLL